MSAFRKCRAARQLSSRSSALVMARILLSEGGVHFDRDSSRLVRGTEGARLLKGVDRSYLPLRGKLDG